MLPDSPIGLSLVDPVGRSLTPVSVVVRWTCPQTYGTPQMFVVSVLDAKTTSVVESKNTTQYPDSAYNTTVTMIFNDSITPGTDYLVTLLSVNYVGASGVVTMSIRTPPRPVLTITAAYANTTTPVTFEYLVTNWDARAFTLSMNVQLCEVAVQRCTSLNGVTVVNASWPLIALKPPTAVGTQYSLDVYLLDCHSICVFLQRFDFRRDVSRLVEYDAQVGTSATVQFETV